MIAVNGKTVEFTSFPDGTSSFRFAPDGDRFQISWKYSDDKECMLLWYLVKHIRANIGLRTPISLWLPYIPNARMDRVKNKDDVFTLKWFAEFINSLRFDKVYVLDAHSNVSLALIDRAVNLDVKSNVETTLLKIGDAVLCYPDEGAAKRYSEMFQRDYVFCIKHRNWRDGKITGLELTSPEKVAGRNVLIVDDICSRGGTFFYTAKALKEAGAKSVFLYVTHCEDTILDGEMIRSGLIDRIFTTNSLISKEHEKIEVYDLWTL